MDRAQLRIWFAVAASVLPVTPLPVVAQVRYEVAGGTVEVLGLRRWTLDMLRDSVRTYAPGRELHDAACMVILREQLQFAEASVATYHMTRPGEPRRFFTSIALIEPQDGAGVVWDTSARDEFSSLRSDYAALILPITDSLGAVARGRILGGVALYHSDSPSRERRLGSASAAVRQDAERTWRFLDERRAEADRQRAMRVVASDGFFVNRMVALAILTNFADRDSTWWVLTRALRDPHEAPRGVAATVLRTLPRRRVDWSSSVVDLRHLLSGTNLRVMPEVFELLVETGVDPTLAPALLRQNATWVLDYLESAVPGASSAAHRLLVRLNGGVDLGTARSAWETSIARL